MTSGNRQFVGGASAARVRMASVAMLSLALCSCRAPLHPSGLAPAAATPPCPAGEECMPAVAQVAPVMAPMMPGFAPTPLPYEVQGSWAPPGIALPWPEDEYVRDGGDDGPPVLVSPDWQVYNLEMEDTVAHYDTEDGRTLVEPSNKVNVYAPCFGAVRTVTRLAGNEQTQPPLGVDTPIRIARNDETLIPASSLQRVQAERQAGMRVPSLARTYQGEGVLGQAQIITAFQDAFLPYENFTVLRTGEFANNEKARLATAAQAAITWTADQGAQVVIDNRAAQVVEGDRRAQATYMVEDFKKPKLRVIKVASTQTACCGEPVDFTVRFDNVGTQVLGNVVILDNLSPRLEYVPDSAQSSLEAAFSVEPNSGNSLVLRWEIDKPIQPGDGGVVRFRCVVR
ncbi:MAG TPA: hypothetical protein VHD36_06165 [Pirellulales bacterium]|nr:hypothetical protein [Pirellulales bacterium]